MRRGREREEGARLDLEVLDPVTGDPIDAGAVTGDAAAVGTPSVRRTRMRRLALLLAVLAAASAAGAGHRVAVLTSLQAVNRSWAEAMALDEAREAADRRVVEATQATGGGPRDPGRRDALRRIGEETTAALLEVEDDLRETWIFDDRVAAVRDQMLEALRFRRFQLSPDRGQLGSTPLQRVDVVLDEQLDRFGLRRATTPRPDLRTAEAAVQDLRRFTPVETGTLLVAARGRRLLHVDVDASLVDDRTLPRPPQRLLSSGDLVVVADGTTVTAYPRRHDRPAVWAVTGTAAVVGRSPADTAVWVTAAEGVRPVAPDGTVGAAVPLPGGGELLADTDGGLLVRRDDALRLHDADTGDQVRELSPGGRFAGASARFVAIQPPGRPALAIHRLEDGSVLSLDLPRTDAGHVVPSPATEEFAFAAGPLAGNIASILRLELRGRGWSLVGVGGPRGTVDEGGVVWSPSGAHLFWLTPEGRLALATGTEASLLRSSLEGLDQVVAFPRQR